MSLVAPIMLAIFVVTVEILLAISLMEAFRHIPMRRTEKHSSLAGKRLDVIRTRILRKKADVMANGLDHPTVN
jgi:hypothetical protein